jgi:hypothetical protein
MKEIQLGNGLYAVVDKEDFEFLAQWKWHAQKDGNTFYAIRDFCVKRKRTTVRMHRLVNQTPDGLDTDHINGNGLDNRKTNLRTATRQQNIINRGMLSTNKSGYRGVSWRKGQNKWRAQICVNYKVIHIGSFGLLHEAVSAYKEKDEELRGNEIRRNIFK